MLSKTLCCQLKAVTRLKPLLEIREMRKERIVLDGAAAKVCAYSEDAALR